MSYNHQATFAIGERVEVATGLPPDRPAFVRGSIQDHPTEQIRGEKVWVSLDNVLHHPAVLHYPAHEVKETWVHVGDIRRLTILELIAEAASWPS
jgi:hypothetical protein